MKTKHKRMAAHIERARFYQAMMEVDYDELLSQCLVHCGLPPIPSEVWAYLRYLDEMAQTITGAPILGHFLNVAEEITIEEAKRRYPGAHIEGQ